MPERIVLERVSCSFGPGCSGLKDIDLSIEPGDIVVIMGKSGEGKSTLLEICTGLRLPERGRVLWNGKPVSEFTYAQLYNERRKIGCVFQRHALISNMSIYDNIALPLRYHGECPESEIAARVVDKMNECGLFNCARLFPESLSAGQLRRAALARALVARPGILVLDEPCDGVDELTREEMLRVIDREHETRGFAVVMVTNYRKLLYTSGGRCMILDNGHLAAFERACPAVEGEMPPPAAFFKGMQGA